MNRKINQINKQHRIKRKQWCLLSYDNKTNIYRMYIYEWDISGPDLEEERDACMLELLRWKRKKVESQKCLL